ncbi:16784_t:CDS:2, partial [Rhizophagus irregularis]
MFLNYSKTHNPSLLLPHYFYWFNGSSWSSRSGIGCYTDDWIDWIDQIVWSNLLKRLRMFVFLREYLPGIGFQLEDFSFLDYLRYLISSSQ